MLPKHTCLHTHIVNINEKKEKKTSDLGFHVRCLDPMAHTNGLDPAAMVLY